MKKNILFPSLILIVLSFISCKKEEINTDLYLYKIYKNDTIETEFHYRNKKVVSVNNYRDNEVYSSMDLKYNDFGKVSETILFIIKYERYDTTTYEYNEENKLISINNDTGNIKYEFNTDGKCSKMTFYKNYPDSVFYSVQYYYTDNNLSKMEWYGGDSIYAGNITYTYDTNKNPLNFSGDLFFDYYNIQRYQYNNCTEMNSDVEFEEGLALFIYTYSFTNTQSHGMDNSILLLYNSTYEYNLTGYPILSRTFDYNEPNQIAERTYQYFEL